MLDIGGKSWSYHTQYPAAGTPNILILAYLQFFNLTIRIYFCMKLFFLIQMQMQSRSPAVHPWMTSRWDTLDCRLTADTCATIKESIMWIRRAVSSKDPSHRSVWAVAVLSSAPLRIVLVIVETDCITIIYRLSNIAPIWTNHVNSAINKEIA